MVFLSRHLAALEADQPRHNSLLGQVERAKQDPALMRFWSLGEGAACAALRRKLYLTVGDLSEEECTVLASAVAGLDFFGCMGPQPSADRIANALTKAGMPQKLAVPLRAFVLKQAPLYPASQGKGHLAQERDRLTFHDWHARFVAEALPEESASTPERADETFRASPIYIWEHEGKPVSMAARTRSTRDGSTISLVYTPPELRGRGYAGSVTAFACEQVFLEGKKMCFLYTDQRNPASNRVYQKIGFQPWCDSAAYVRDHARAVAPGNRAPV